MGHFLDEKHIRDLIQPGHLERLPADISLRGPFELMIRNLDTLIWTTPGCKLLFGVKKNAYGTLVFTDGIIETDGKAYLIASV